MTDSFYSQQYENAGPIARPVVQRSQYLADALRALQNTGENPIRSPGQLVANLLAQALTQYGQHRAQGQLQNATAKDAANDPLTLAFQNMTGGAPAAAPQAGLADALSGGATPPAPSPMADAIAPPVAPPQAAPVAPPGPGGPQTMGPSPTGLYTSQGPMPAQPPQATGPGLPTPTDPVGPGRVGDEAQWQQHLMAAQSGAPPPMQPPMPQQAPQMPAPPAAQPPTADALPPAGAPPAVPAASNAGSAGGMPSGRGVSSITPEQQQYVLALLQNPQTHAQGVALARQLIGHAMAPTQWRTATQNGVTVFFDPEDPSRRFSMPQDQATQSHVMTAEAAGITGAPPGMMVARDPNGNISVVYQPPAGMQQGPDGRLGPRPGMETTSGPAGPGSGFTSGTVTQHDPMGATSVLQAPPTGYQGPGGAGGAVPMGPNDPHSPAIRVPALVGIQQQLRPQLDEARDLAGNINSARSGAALHNGPGDILLMNGLQHLTDTGIVRQEDMTNQIHSAGLPGTIESTMQWLRGGGQFSPAQRQSMLAAAERLYGPRLQNLRAQVEGHRHLLDEQFGPGSYDYVVPPEMRQQLGWEPHPGQPGIADVAHRLQQLTQQVGQHAQQAPHRRVTGVTQVGP